MSSAGVGFSNRDAGACSNLVPLRVPWVGVGGRIPPPPVSSSACLGGGKAAPLPVLGHAWGCPSITLTSCPRRPLRWCRRGVILLGKAMLLLQGPGAVRGWGVYGLFAGSLGSLVQRCYPTALGVLGTHLGATRGSWWCVVPAFSSKFCLAVVAPGSCFVLILLNACDGPRQSQQQLPVRLLPGHGSFPEFGPGSVFQS